MNFTLYITEKLDKYYRIAVEIKKSERRTKDVKKD